jgi:nucleoside-diphosphate-sugar epimerase
MSQHVIVGAGAVGSAAATLLAERGERVRVVTRSGGGPAHPGVERVAADAADADRLTELTQGALALYNCANPQYDRWLTDWPPLHAALLGAAQRTGATLVTMSNLYVYGPVDGPMTEDTPMAARHPKLKLRADFWREALALHRAGRIRTAAVRASDYIEAQGLLGYGMGRPLLAGRRAYIPAPQDVPHTWTSTADAAALLVTVATDERAAGRVWHVPSNPPLTIRQLAERFTEATGSPRARLSTIPYPAMWTLGLFSPMVRELRTTRYQFTRPFVMDSAAAEQAFGLKPRPLHDSLVEAARRLRD